MQEGAYLRLLPFQSNRYQASSRMEVFFRPAGMPTLRNGSQAALPIEKEFMHIAGSGVLGSEHYHCILDKGKEYETW